jgi:hypothetical protein
MNATAVSVSSDFGDLSKAERLPRLLRGNARIHRGQCQPAMYAPNG